MQFQSVSRTDVGVGSVTSFEEVSSAYSTAPDERVELLKRSRFLLQTMKTKRKMSKFLSTNFIFLKYVYLIISVVNKNLHQVVIVTIKKKFT